MQRETGRIWNLPYCRYECIKLMTGGESRAAGYVCLDVQAAEAVLRSFWPILKSGGVRRVSISPVRIRMPTMCKEQCWALNFRTLGLEITERHKRELRLSFLRASGSCSAVNRTPRCLLSTWIAMSWLQEGETNGIRLLWPWLGAQCLSHLGDSWVTVTQKPAREEVLCPLHSPIHDRTERQSHTWIGF